MLVEFVAQPEFEVIQLLSAASGDGIDKLNMEAIALDLAAGNAQCYKFTWNDTTCWTLIAIQEGNGKRELEILSATSLGRGGWHIREWSRLISKLAADCGCSAVYTAVHNIRLGEALNVLGWKPAYVTLRLETEHEHQENHKNH